MYATRNGNINPFQMEDNFRWESLQPIKSHSPQMKGEASSGTSAIVSAESILTKVRGGFPSSLTQNKTYSSLQIVSMNKNSHLGNRWQAWGEIHVQLQYEKTCEQTSIP